MVQPVFVTHDSTYVCYLLIIVNDKLDSK